MKLSYILLLDTDHCSPNPCNGHTCVQEKDKSVCLCEDGFSGERCQNVPNLCSASTCTNSGTCLNTGFNFTCVCPAGYRGQRCETKIGNNNHIRMKNIWNVRSQNFFIHQKFKLNEVTLISNQNLRIVNDVTPYSVFQWTADGANGVHFLLVQWLVMGEIKHECENARALRPTLMVCHAIWSLVQKHYLAMMILVRVS